MALGLFEALVTGAILPGNMLTPTRLKAVTGLAGAADLMRELGFAGNPLSVNADELGLGEFPDNRVIRTAGSRARGYGVFIAEVASRPRSLKTFGRKLLERFHDRPLGVVGVKGRDGGWERFIVARPRSVKGVLGAVRVSKLEVDVTSPTHHDAEVLSSIGWRGDEREAQARIDRSMDAEAVTRRFYIELAEHHQKLIDAIQAATESDPSVLAGVKSAVGPGDDPIERVALRILTQLLFCWFLQRKRLLAGDPEYLITRFRRHSGRYYQTGLEPLFYDALAKPPGQRPAGAPGPEVPFLNGGLFARTYGDVSLPLSDGIFDLERGLLGFLSRWTFTVAEDVPDETEIAVDPEMLGKVFENLISDDQAKRQGTVYTPRAVVHFMCREALVPWLQDRLKVSEEWARRLLVEDDAFEAHTEAIGAKEALDLAERLDEAVRDLKVLDPAVGSGAFLLGMLAEVVRLRRMCLRVSSGREATSEEIVAWKLQAIERSLFGVDINPTAIELCRLRLWLSLVVDLPEGQVPHALPNLEHRTVVANSLTDFVNGIQVQNTREGQAAGLEVAELPTRQILGLRHAYFEATDPDTKAVLREELEKEEDKLIEHVFEEARRHGERSPEARAQLEELVGRFRSWDREFPVFVPAFHAPDVWLEGGWDVTIMNPPYLGKKEVAQHLDAMRRADYARHFGGLNDLMILFARRARELTRPGGVISMIFNDSIFTSTDAEDVRWQMFEGSSVLVCARTKCFEGKAVNGGVVVLHRTNPDASPALRWVEGYRKPTGDFASASDPLPFTGKPGRMATAGSMEVFSAPGEVFRKLPHRPLYRPSKEAIALLDRFTATERWATVGTREGWARLSNTRALEHEIDDLGARGWYDRLEPRQWVLLGYVIEGGQGLATADDRHFIGAIRGTGAGEEHQENLERLEALLYEREPSLAREYDRLRTGGLKQEEALLALWDDMANDAVLSKIWPKGATFRIAPKSQVRTRPLTERERERGIASGPFWVPFEKGDQSQPVEDEEGRVTYLGARWIRENPVVIDWSEDSVRLLRLRARGHLSRRKPYFRNEHLWFTEGVAWNAIASYLRCRRVESTSMFGHGAPFIRPTADWLTRDSLMALLNTSVIDFLLRTLLSSRMNIHPGEIRKLPVPVLSDVQNKQLSALSERAIEEKLAADQGQSSQLTVIEAQIDTYVRDLYGVPRDAKLWVVR